ncbi:LRR and NB-ARC domain disease resistance protein [Medicago truncatula]|uniref:LRR and NB-ARC domain disease resistance protein n=1 Tax=Medicago truncatula TaxID=3880 RepID=A0A072TY88_MEDTR|nr:LRR and NB-ARC domain disease resistance protein [Medicago truncatula]
MGRKKNEDCRKHVTEGVENGHNYWICNYCNEKYSGGASRIEAQLGLNGKGGGIKPCSKYHEGVYNNMASTSSNPPLQVVEGVPQVIGTHIRSLLNHQNNAEIMNLSEGMNSSGCNISVYESEINQLKQLVIDLERDENDIAKQLQSLESRGKKRKPEVDEWLEELLNLKESANEMNSSDDIHEINHFIDNMKRHKKKKPFTLSTEFVGGRLDEKIHKVLKQLDDDKVFVIGIYGMGGVGKTLHATLVENEVKRKATFKHVFWVTVSHNYSILKLQHNIAKRIGLKLDEDDEKVRADNLSLALEKKGKSILILDDVWKYIDLKKVGIHPKVNGIKVILTTRLKHVCHQMDCQPCAILQIDPLNGNNKDWELFMLKLGHDGTPKIFPNEIEKIARCIVERFKGLPLAINVMARTMKGVDDFHQWKHALNKLRKLEMGQEVEEEIFKVLKRSFDNLMEKNLQNCFLYCALLSTGTLIEKDELIMKLVDNGQINGSMCLEEIFVEGNTILNKLESHSLISLYNNKVATHQMVRNMACYILKQSKRDAIVKFKECVTEIPLSHEWAAKLELVHMWGCDIGPIPEGMSPNCPNLSTLIINRVSISHVPESFFKYMNSLSILDISYNKRLESLPNSVSELRSLITLVLKSCYSLKHVPPLGELQALSRLVISKTSIEEAPQGLEKLINLKWLDLSSNKCLNMDTRSFLSNLTKIQYLNLQHTNALIKVEDIQRMNMLECLGGGFDCKDHKQYMQKNLDMSFGPKSYILTFASVWGEDGVSLIRFDSDDPETKTMKFGNCDHSSHILPKDLTYLCIEKNSHWVCLCDALLCNTDFSSLRKIKTYYCQRLKSLFCLSGFCSFCTMIHNLEVLDLQRLESLTIVCKEVFGVRQSLTQGGIFSCLKKFNIYHCHLIEKLFRPQLVQQLQNLETIDVQHCYSMKEIFVVSNSDDNDQSIISLPKLTRLTLYYLPELKIVCKGSISCGSSPKVDIFNCPNLERYPTIQRC